jgi:hypothetical protein
MHSFMSSSNLNVIIAIVGSRKRVKLSWFIIEHHTMKLYGELRLAVYVPYVSDT